VIYVDDNGKAEFDSTVAELSECLRHYYRAISPWMPTETKETLLKDLADYLDLNTPEETPTEEFPELKKYWKRDTVSRLELASIANCLRHDIKDPYET
jgi:hypothetical protein